MSGRFMGCHVPRTYTSPLLTVSLDVIVFQGRWIGISCAKAMLGTRYAGNSAASRLAVSGKLHLSPKEHTRHD